MVSEGFKTYSGSVKKSLMPAAGLSNQRLMKIVQRTALHFKKQ